MYKGERLNTVSHLIGAALSLAGLVILTINASTQGDPWKIVSSSVYGVTFAALYFFLPSITQVEAERNPFFEELITALFIF